MAGVALRLTDVEFAFPAGFQMGPLSLRIDAGEMVAVLGPNGSGKSTCFRLIAGTLTPARGQVELGDAYARHLSRREVAQQLAVVPQDVTVPYGMSVRDVVALGRTPYSRLLGGWGAADRVAMERALHLTETAALARRNFGALSGGERQRVLLAMALAQEPSALLLDEPTSHLDVHYQVELLDLLSQLHNQQGITLVATLHDLNLAALYFPRLVVMHRGRLAADGTPEEVLRREQLEPVFGQSLVYARHPAIDVPLVAPVPGAVQQARTRSRPAV